MSQNVSEYIVVSADITQCVFVSRGNITECVTGYSGDIIQVCHLVHS